ncbi:hypothetical protein DSECCO2_466840 [anaerobic digester metagenome]
MQGRVFGVVAALMLWSTLVLADQRVTVPLVQGEDRAAAVGRAFDEALALETRVIAGPALTPARLKAVMGVLVKERDSLVLGYKETAGDAGNATVAGNATGEALTLDVRVHGAGLKARLRDLGVLSTLTGPLPYVLRLSGVEPSRTKRLSALQELSGLAPVAAAGADVPVLTLSQGRDWSGVLSLGEWNSTRSAKTLDEVWLAVWKDYFSRPAQAGGGGAGVEVRISGWLSSMGPMEFDRLMDGWNAEIERKALIGVEMEGQGMAGVWRITTGSREALSRRLEDAAKAQGLTVRIR